MHNGVQLSPEKANFIADLPKKKEPNKQKW